MDVVTSKAGDVGAQAVPDQVDVLKLEERVLLQGKIKKINLKEVIPPSPQLSGHVASLPPAGLKPKSKNELGRGGR